MLVTLESDDGRIIQFEAEEKASNMTDFMNNYYATIEEMEE